MNNNNNEEYATPTYQTQSSLDIELQSLESLDINPMDYLATSYTDSDDDFNLPLYPAESNNPGESLFITSFWQLQSCLSLAIASLFQLANIVSAPSVLTELFYYWLIDCESLFYKHYDG